MSLFKNKKEITRTELRKALRETRETISGTGGKRYPIKERESMERDLFGWRKYGEKISDRDFKEGLRKLRSKEMREGSPDKREDIKKQREFLEDVSGIETH